MRRFTVLPALALLLCVAVGCPQEKQDKPDDFERLRHQMVETQLSSSRGGLADPVRDPAVLAAMRKVPRHRFVPTEMMKYAYADHPLPIGYEQTISQPYMVGKMTELVEPRREHRVLEIGTGSGYQAAVLAELVAEVYTIEIVEPLGREAQQRLAELGYKNVHTRLGDGYEGWPEAAPFDSIVVTAGAKHIPPKLVEQLKPGGRMVIPVGATLHSQKLLLVTKEKKPPHKVQTRELMEVRFVPLVRAGER